MRQNKNVQILENLKHLMARIIIDMRVVLLLVECDL